MKTLVLVHGTWGRAQPWHLPGSLLRAMAEARDIRVFDFLWSGVLAGVPTKLPGDPAEAANGADDGKLLPWLDAGEKLNLVLGNVAGPVNVLSHSHGLQVVAFSALKGRAFDTAISVSGPVRRDMQRARRAAKANIGHWIQFADPSDFDKTIIEGEFLDGELGRVFDLPEGQTIYTYMTGHSGALTDAKWLGMMLDAL
jgi:hypothetical protein